MDHSELNTKYPLQEFNWGNRQASSDTPTLEPVVLRWPTTIKPEHLGSPFERGSDDSIVFTDDAPGCRFRVVVEPDGNGGYSLAIHGWCGQGKPNTLIAGLQDMERRAEKPYAPLARTALTDLQAAHDATVPTRLSIAYDADGRSWDARELITKALPGLKTGEFNYEGPSAPAGADNAMELSV